MTFAPQLTRLSCGLLITLLFCTATFSADLSGIPVPALHWQPCADFPDTECATARVPLDYDDVDGPRTSIALARLKASDPVHRVGTLFVNPGGPGAPGLDLIFFGFAAALQTELKGRFDIVGFDPRGVGSSEPLHCFATADALSEFVNSQPIFPYEVGQQRPFFDHFKQLPSKCFGNGGRIARHMSTADVVRDLDLLRKAVGDARLNFVGFSYGSYIGNTYANLFPQKVRALVIDGVLDPRLWSSGAQILSDRTDTAAVLEEFLRLCDEAQDTCLLSAGGHASQRYWQLVKALRREPVDFGGGFVYFYDFLVSDTAGILATPEFWPDFAVFLDSLLEASAGNATAAGMAGRLRKSLLARLNPRQADYPNFYDAYAGNQCSDTQYPATFPVFSAVDRFAENGSIFGPYWWWQNTACAHWPVAPDRYAGPWKTATSSAVLVVGNFFDPETGYGGAVATSHLLQNSRLLSYAGWGHTATFRNECVTRHVSAYLVNGKLPKKGTVCPANPNPFVPLASARAVPRAPLIGLPPPWRFATVRGQ